MSDHTGPGAIVVGAAEGPVGAAAVAWAAQEAARSRSGVRLVHGLSVPAGSHPGQSLAGLDVRRTLTALANLTLSDAAAQVREAAPGCAVETHLVQGGAVGAIHAHSDDAALVVVGSDGLGPLVDLVLGGIVRGLCRDTDVPVVAVPYHQDRSPARAPGGDAPVLVGDDGTPEAASAVSFAVARAADRGVPLVVVRAGSVSPSAEDPPREAVERGVPTRVVVADGHADRVLVDEAEDAEAIVLGRGVHHLLRPRARTRPDVLRRATCPVIVVPPVRAGAGTSGPGGADRAADVRP